MLKPKQIIKPIAVLGFFYGLVKSALVLMDPLAIGVHNHSVAKTLTYRWNSGDDSLKTGMTFAHTGSTVNRSPQAGLANNAALELLPARGFILSAGDTPHAGDATDATLGREFDAIVFGEVDGFVALEPGKDYFAIGNIGQIGLFADIGVGDFVIPVGYAMTDTKLYFIPPTPHKADGTYELKA